MADFNLIIETSLSELNYPFFTKIFAKSKEKKIQQCLRKLFLYRTSDTYKSQKFNITIKTFPQQISFDFSDHNEEFFCFFKRTPSIPFLKNTFWKDVKLKHKKYMGAHRQSTWVTVRNLFSQHKTLPLLAQCKKNGLAMESLIIPIPEVLGFLNRYFLKKDLILFFKWLINICHFSVIYS